MPCRPAWCRHRYLVGGSRGEGHGEVHLTLVVGVALLGLGISNAQLWRRGWRGPGRCWRLWGLGRGRWGRLLHWRLAWAACCITRSEEGQGEGPRSGIEGGGLDGVGASLQGAPDAGVVPHAAAVVVLDGPATALLGAGAEVEIGVRAGLEIEGHLPPLRQGELVVAGGSGHCAPPRRTRQRNDRSRNHPR